MAAARAYLGRNLRLRLPAVQCKRFLSSSQNTKEGDVPAISDGVVVGVYEQDEKQAFSLTDTAKNLDEKTSGKLSQLLNLSGFNGKLGKSRVFYGVGEDLPCIAAVGLGKVEPVSDEQEELDQDLNRLRQAAAVGARALKNVGVQKIHFDPCNNAQAIAEGARLGLYNFQQFKSSKKQKRIPDIQLLGQSADASEAWGDGLVYADGQIFARELMEMPGNYLTPTIFSETAAERLGKTEKIEVIIRDEAWAKEMKMNSFLIVGKGSCEPSKFLEMKYMGAKSAEEQPIVLVGKGVTFDSGGISLKPSGGMKLMRGDMGGAASVTATIEAVAKLQLPINVIALTPLCENMPSGTAVKPGDVVTAMNGKTIEVDNTDAEGRLILADALCYAHSFNPSTIVNVATLTGAMDVALGSGATGVFTNSTRLWSYLHKSGFRTGDRMWRMPLFQCYSKDIESGIADIMNVSKRKGSAGSCTAAAFLKEFVSMSCWAHLDIAGVMKNTDDIPYLGKGMSGRPTRTLIELVRLIAQERL